MLIRQQTEQTIQCHDSPGRSSVRSERGVVLPVVIVLSAIALLFMTTLLYMIMRGTQATGMEKRYRTTRDAAFGGWEIMTKLMATRGGPVAQTDFISTLNTNNLNSAITTMGTCSGTAGGTQQYTQLAAKLMTPSTSWSAACSPILTIDPNTAGSYDLILRLGTDPQYTVYGKIVNTVSGNSGADSNGLVGCGVICSSGEVNVVPKPYLYTVEIDAENASAPAERAKLSILYQY